MNAIEAQVDVAQRFTPLLRASDAEYWPAVRTRLTEDGIDPRDVAVGDVYGEQGGPHVIVVTREGRAMRVQTRYNPFEGPEYEVEELNNLDTADDRVEEWTSIYAGLRILAEEAPGTLDPIRALAEGVKRRTREMREDIASDWSEFRSFLARQGVDASQAVLLEWHETQSDDLYTQRLGTILFNGKWFTYVASVTPPMGPVLAVISWTPVVEARARETHGAEIDAALRVGNDLEG